MKYILRYREFRESIETENYPVPQSAVMPAKDDKIWYYIKHKVNDSPLWGMKLKKQEKRNKDKRAKNII